MGRGGCGGWFVFKSQSNRGRKKGKRSKLAILNRTCQSPTPARSAGALRSRGCPQPCKDRSGSLHRGFIQAAAAHRRKAGGTSSLHTTALIPGHAASSQATEQRENTCYRRRRVFPAALRCGGTIPPICKVYATRTGERHHQTQCLYVRQNLSQGRQSKQDFLGVLVWLKSFYIYFYTKFKKKKRGSQSIAQRLWPSTDSAHSHASLRWRAAPMAVPNTRRAVA